MKTREVPAHLLDITRFECQQCAGCCKNLRVTVTYSDIARWKREGRWDILQRVAFVEDRSGRMDFCLDETATQNAQCPFLSADNRCRIHSTKPQVCRDFPFNGSREPVALCRGVGKGPPVPAQVCETIYQRERRDLRRLHFHTYDIMNLLLCARLVARHPIEGEGQREDQAQDLDDGGERTNGPIR